MVVDNLRMYCQIAELTKDFDKIVYWPARASCGPVRLLPIDTGRQTKLFEEEEYFVKTCTP